jgi:putative glycosyltransferase (TIGR04372 family)
MGVPAKTPFVCFHARDKAYLDKAFSSRPPDGWSYHDYRDCDIENYFPAVEQLASKGLYALRMGHFVEKPLAGRDPKIIDYASRFRSDFVDVWLLARCKFFLGNTAGLYSLATTFNTPVAVANWTPFGVTPFRREDLVIHKKYWDTRENRAIGFRELWARKADYLISSEEYTRAGIRLIENTAEEILALAQEMNARLDNNWAPEPDDEALQARFWDLFPQNHPARGRLCRVGARYLRDNRDLLA